MIKILLEKLRLYQDELYLGALITMVALIGFGLGRLSAEYQNTDLDIESTLVNQTALDKIAAGASPEKATLSSGDGGVVNGKTNNQTPAMIRKIVGNKQSKIYHFEDCPGALKMRAENKVFFASVLDAQNADYRPAGNCAGLE